MIELTRLSARPGGGAFELKEITFTLGQGSYGVVIGPAGAGKTTLLETVAGLVRATSGTILLGGEDVTRHPPELRRVGMVYQHAYLFPHLSVAENIGYGAVSTSVADEMTARFGVGALVGRRVDALSGGERQLVALARALSGRPEIVLLDEPFASLDNRTRSAARRALRTLHMERRFTVLHVTHDFTEAGLLGERMMLLDHGRLLQSGTPVELFRRPASAAIADFLGAENVFAGQVRPIDVNAVSAEVPDTGESGVVNRSAAFSTGALTFWAAGEMPDGATHAVIRSEEIALSLTPASSSIRNQFRGRIAEIAESGAVTRVTVDVSGTPLVAAITTRSLEELGLAVGVEVIAAFKATAVHLC
jgi:molybdopterin-binding protein